MRIKIGLFVGIVLFFCLVVTGFFGASAVFSSDDGKEAEFRAALEAMMRDSSSDAEEEGDTLKDDELVDRQGNETGSNTWYGEGTRNITGSFNSCFGSDAGASSNLSGSSNTFVGDNAGDGNTAGAKNTFVGDDAGTNNTLGDNNTFIGEDAGRATNSGSNNTFVGKNAGVAHSSGSANTFIGYEAGNKTTNPIANTFVGALAGHANTSGVANTCIGFNTGNNSQTGSRNIFIGNMAGLGETGSDKLYIGSGLLPLIFGDMDADLLTVNGSLGVGTKTVPTKFTVVKEGVTEATTFANYSATFFNTGSAYFGFRNTTDNAEGFFGVGGGAGARFGLGSITNNAVEFFANNGVRMVLHTSGALQMASGAWCTLAGVWQNASSREYKENIKSISSSKAMDALEQLNPVEFNYKVDSKEKHLGFIAEDVPDLVATKDRKGMSPMDVVAVLTKVVQEQQKLNQMQQKKISDLSKKMEDLEKELKMRVPHTMAKVQVVN